MILIDANVFMYAAGAPHPYRGPSEVYLGRVARGDVEAVIDAETLQEILHRYRAIRRWNQGRAVYDLAKRIVPVVVPIGVEVLDLARDLLDRYTSVMARDALHAAVVIHIGASAICSFDRDFDELSEVTRVEPTP